MSETVCLGMRGKNLRLVIKLSFFCLSCFEDKAVSVKMNRNVKRSREDNCGKVMFEKIMSLLSEKRKPHGQIKVFYRGAYPR